MSRCPDPKCPGWDIFKGTVRRCSKCARFQTDAEVALYLACDNSVLRVAKAAAVEALEAAEHWLQEERENPGQATPDEILRVIGAALANARGESVCPRCGRTPSSYAPNTGDCIACRYSPIGSK